MKQELTQEEVDTLLETKIDEQTVVRDASAIQFLSWVLKKLNNLSAFNSDVAELTARANRVPGSILAESDKIEILLKLKKIGVL